jgi:hypothetical protein
MAAGSAVGPGSGWPWVRVKNGAYLTLTTMRAAGRCSAATSAVTSPASRATSAATRSQSSMSCWKVVSRLRERGW